MTQKPKIIVILGPTATGKSDLAVHLAKKFKGEVISADSRQVYRGLNIGTGKITADEMQGVPHHLLDITEPQERFTVVKFQELAREKISEIFSRGHIPIICGGTGFYIESLLTGSVLPEVKPDEELKNELAKKTPGELFNMLQKLDPVRAKNIDPKNSRRLIRSIELAQALGSVPKIQSISPDYSYLKIGLNLPPEELKNKIKLRLNKRLKMGMIDEAKNLHEKGLSFERMIELGLEYKYLALFLKGEISEQEMKTVLEHEIWHYAKRQMTWFKRDKEIKWFYPDHNQEIDQCVREFLRY
jgi:tRNA dimethylallyltransferase